MKTLGETVILAEGTEKEILAGSDEARGAPDRPRPPGAEETGTRALTFEAAPHLLAAEAVEAGAGPELLPRAGKASSFEVSTGSGVAGWRVLAGAEVEDAAGALLPREGKGSGAPSRPWRYRQEENR